LEDDSLSTHTQAVSTQRTSKVVREIAETVILTVIIFLVVRLAVQNFRVQGTSMLPTVHNGDLVLVNKVDYLIHGPEHGDVIVFRYPRNTSEDFIKRVIGIPGDLVRVKDGAGVWVNHHRIKESYILARPFYSWGPRRVPPNDYFVLGDNRNNSFDSHVWGYVPRHDIIGKALVAYWPLNQLKFFSF